MSESKEHVTGFGVGGDRPIPLSHECAVQHRSRNLRVIVYGSRDPRALQKVVDEHTAALLGLVNHVYEGIPVVLPTVRSMQHLLGTLECDDIMDGVAAFDGGDRSTSSLPLYTRSDTSSAELEAVEFASTPRKRALFLVGLHLEPEIGAYFSEDVQATELVTILRERVLPVAVPWFISGMCQDPQSFCNLVAILCQMWPHEVYDDTTFRMDDTDAAMDSAECV
jgi:hypothetical protein